MTELQDRGPTTPEHPSSAERARSTTRDDLWKNDRVDSAGWAALFFWGALVVLASNTTFSADLSWWDGWAVFFVGGGVIVLVQALVRLAMPAYRSKWGWAIIWATIWFALGLGGLLSPAWYALPLFGIAVVSLNDAVARNR